MITKQLGHMICKLIANFDNIGLYSRKDILNLLLLLLTRIQSWNSNSTVLYLLDVICSAAFAQAEYQITTN